MTFCTIILSVRFVILIVSPNWRFNVDEFISPVFGRQEFTGEYRNIEKPKKEVKRQREKLHDLDETDAFLNTLKEFRNNL